jgi:hypothetical protein
MDMRNAANAMQAATTEIPVVTFHLSLRSSSSIAGVVTLAGSCFCLFLMGAMNYQMSYEFFASEYIAWLFEF